VKVVVLAGGVGTRLWPESRQARPKQLLSLVSERTMLQETVDRVLPLTAPENVYVVTARPYVRAVVRQLPDVPAGNIIGEPLGRGSAPAIGLAAALLDGAGDDVLAFLPADHHIADPAGFRLALQAAGEVARDGYLVTLGIRPTGPHGGYGYIQQGDELGRHQGLPAYKVARFTEKPDAPAARAFVESGKYSWNAGMFVGMARTFLEEIALHLPGLASRLATIQAVRGMRKERAVLNAVWPGVEIVTIDYGVMEKTHRAAIIPIDIGWTDVGDWTTLAEALETDAAGNTVRGEHLGIDTAGCLIRGRGDRLIATIGLRDMVIVDAGDALLICPKARSQEAKQIVERLRAGGGERYL
jgi:mannose-1-phosphate guanylyltransferase